MVNLLNSHASVFYLVLTLAVSWYVVHRGRTAKWAIIGALSWYGIANGIYFITWIAVSLVEHVTDLVQIRCDCHLPELKTLTVDLERLLRVMGMQLASITVLGTFYSWTPIFGRVFWHYFWLIAAVFVWCGITWIFDVPMVWFVTVHNGLYIGMLIALWNVETDNNNARAV